MKRKDIISHLKKYFKIQELVCKHTYNTFKDDSWQFLDTELLHTLLVLRTQILKVPIVINDYVFGGRNQQRGLRCNICPLVKNKTLANRIYLSAHINGAAVDIVFGVSTGMTAAKARSLIKKNQHLLPYNIRMEKDVTWLHVDTYDKDIKIYEFNP